MMRSLALYIFLLTLRTVCAVGSTEDLGTNMTVRVAQKLKSLNEANPITRVVGLLEEMTTTVEAEMKDDKEVFGKMMCWCNNNKYTLTEAIKDGEKRVMKYSVMVGALVARTDGYTSSLEALLGKIDGANMTLFEAANLRAKERAEFQDFEKMSINSIEQLKAAILILSRHGVDGPIGSDERVAENIIDDLVQKVGSPATAANFLQRMSTKDDAFHMDKLHDLEAFDPEDAADASTGVDDEAPVVQSTTVTTTPPAQPVKGGFLQKTGASMAKSVVPHFAQHKALTDLEIVTLQKAKKVAAAFMQTHHGYTDEPFEGNFQGASYEIQGFMKNMKFEMERELLAAQKAEARAQFLFVRLRKSKLDEIELAKKIEQLQQDEKTETDNALVWARMDYEDSIIALTEDKKNLKIVTAKCAEEQAAFEQRKADRADELTAISETIDILTTDEGRDAMNVAYKNDVRFLQVKSKTNGRQGESAAVRQKALDVLRTAAARTNSLNLEFLASQVQIDDFQAVKLMIEKMIKQMKKQQDDEVTKNDWCIQELHKDEIGMTKLRDTQLEQENAIKMLEQKVKDLTEEIDALEDKVKGMEKNLDDARKQRAAEKAEYQEMSYNQGVTKQVLQRALLRLGEFYDAKAVASKGAQLTQKEAHTQPAAVTHYYTVEDATSELIIAPADVSKPAPEMMTYKPHSGAAGVFQMMEKLIFDVKRDMKETDNEEDKAASDFVKYEGVAMKAIADTNDEKSGKEQERNQASLKKKLTAEDLETTKEDYAALNSYDSTTHSECDYLVKNFEVRQKSRGDEITALQEALQILSGAIDR